MKESIFKNHIKSIPNFPKEGILFRDILPIFMQPEICKELIDSMSKSEQLKNADCLIAIDARGFLLGTPLSLNLKKPLIVARKPNKLPGKVITKNYKLEYGENSLSLQEDVIDKYKTFAIIDDLLATGGTVGCLVELLEEKEKHINCLSVVIELKELNGREKFNFPIYSQVTY